MDISKSAHGRQEFDDYSSFISKGLLSTRTVLLSGEINDRSAHSVVGQLMFLNAESRTEPIRLIVNSGGGAISSGFAIYDTMRFITAPIVTIGAGIVASMGVTIFLAAPRESRLSLPNTRYMIHQPLITGTVVAPASDLEINAREMIRLKERLNHLISEASGQPLSSVERDTQRDFWLDAEAATEYGLVGRIISSENEIGNL